MCRQGRQNTVIGTGTRQVDLSIERLLAGFRRSGQALGDFSCRFIVEKPRPPPPPGPMPDFRIADAGTGGAAPNRLPAPVGAAAGVLVRWAGLRLHTYGGRMVFAYLYIAIVYMIGSIPEIGK